MGRSRFGKLCPFSHLADLCAQAHKALLARHVPGITRRYTKGLLQVLDRRLVVLMLDQRAGIAERLRGRAVHGFHADRGWCPPRGALCPATLALWRRVIHPTLPFPQTPRFLPRLHDGPRARASVLSERQDEYTPAHTHTHTHTHTGG
jgi:hypothetical protein